MRGINHWHFRPYRPFHKEEDVLKPFICRLAPGADFIELEWFDNGSLDEHSLMWRERGKNQAWNKTICHSNRMIINNLVSNTDYEVIVSRKCLPGITSSIRLARTGLCPGKVVNYLHPEDELYSFSGRALCSPSIVKLTSDSLLVSMDLFAPGAPQNLTILCRSDDRGKSWRYVTDLFPCYWGTLFLHRSRLYMLACSTEYGDIMIGVSDDQGFTWSKPVHLFVGSSSNLTSGWQKTTTPIITHDGFLMASIDYGAWKEGGHHIGLLAIPEDADLMDPVNWSCSELTGYNPEWPNAPVGNSTGILEGNMVVGRDGKLLDILRIGLINCIPSHGLAVALEADPDNIETAMKFHRFIDMPSGSNSKSHILHDRVSNQYIAIGNICVEAKTPGQRNVLALQASENLYDWRLVKILLDYRDHDPQETGFQYISFIINGDDIMYLSRTAINKARNYHDANYMTFHVVEKFRQLL